MTPKLPILTLASAAVLSLALGSAQAEDAPAAAPPPAAAPAEAAPVDPMRAEMEKRWEAAMAARKAAREAYLAELKKRLAEAGIEPPEGLDEATTPMTPEERNAKRAERWAKMRERAAERGVELPETPPWEAAEQRRKEMLERYNAYRATIEAMTDEQKEAIAALFGGGRRGPAPHGPMGGYGMPPEMPEPPAMPELPPMPEMPAMPAPPAPPAG